MFTCSLLILQGGKRFGSTRGGKEALPIPGLPLQWTDLQTALDQEQKKTAKMQEQCDRLREKNVAQANERKQTVKVQGQSQT